MINQYFLIILKVILTIQVTAGHHNLSCTVEFVDTEAMGIQCNLQGISSANYIYQIDFIINNVTSKNTSSTYTWCDSTSISTTEQTSWCNFSTEILFSFLSPGDNDIIMIVKADNNNTREEIAQSNIISISLTDKLQELLCGLPEFDGNDYSVSTLKCLTPLSYNEASCKLLLKTNATLRRYSSSIIQEIYLPNQNKLNKYALGCVFTLFSSELGIGQHQFQAIVSTKGDNVTSPWTAPVTYYYPTKLNLTVNGQMDGVTVNLGQNVTFNCAGDGYPPYTPYFGQILMDTNFSWDSERMYGAELKKQISSCEQAGFFECWTYNFNIVKSSRVYIKIPCEMRYRSEKSKNSSRYFVGEFKGHFYWVSRFNIPVFGYPEPKYMVLSKLKPSDSDINSDMVNVKYIGDSGPYGDIWITFKNADLISKMTNFTLSVNNGIGHTTLFDFAIEANAGERLNMDTIMVIILFSFLLAIIYFKIPM